MSDRSWAKISIGGTLKQKKVKEFLDLLEQEDLADSLPDKPLEWLKMLWESPGHVLELEDGEVRGGEFGDLEQWLRDNKLPFTRVTASCPGVWDSEIIHYRPGFEGTSYAILSDDGVPMIEQAVVNALIEQHRKGTLSRLIKALESRMVKNVPALPPFRMEGPYPSS